LIDGCGRISPGLNHAVIVGDAGLIDGHGGRRFSRLPLHSPGYSD
jgi:hypothetical protein